MVGAVSLAASEAERAHGALDDRPELALACLKRFVSGEWGAEEARASLDDLDLDATVGDRDARWASFNFAVHAASTAATVATDRDYWSRTESRRARASVLDSVGFSLVASGYSYDEAAAAAARAMSAATDQPMPGDVSSLARRISSYDPLRYEHLLPAYFATYLGRSADQRYLRFDKTHPQGFMLTRRAKVIERPFVTWLERSCQSERVFGAPLDPDLRSDPVGSYREVRVEKAAWVVYFADFDAARRSLPAPLGTRDVRRLGEHDGRGGWCVGHPCHGAHAKAADDVARQGRHRRHHAMLLRCDVAVAVDQSDDVEAIFWGESVPASRAVPLVRDEGGGPFWGVAGPDGSVAWDGEEHGERGLAAAVRWASAQAGRRGLWRPVG